MVGFSLFPDWNAKDFLRYFCQVGRGSSWWKEYLWVISNGDFREGRVMKTIAFFQADGSKVPYGSSGKIDFWKMSSTY